MPFDRDMIGELRADASTMAFHERCFVFDSLSISYIVDEPYTERVLRGGVNATNITVGTEGTLDETLRWIETALRGIERNPLVVQATTVAELRTAKDEGKLAVILGTQGSAMVGADLTGLDTLCQLGVRFFGLAYTGPTLFADGCGEKRDAGVSSYGDELIEAVNALPMMLDLSHCGHRTRAEGAAKARAPVNTHSNAHAVFASDRNTTDETMRTIVDKGGVCAVVAHPCFVRRPKASLDDLLDHLDHMVRLLGRENVGISTDFIDWFQDREIQVNPRWHRLRPDIFAGVENYFTLPYPTGLENIRLLPNLTQGLFDRGYDRDQIAAILGGNWLRAMERFLG